MPRIESWQISHPTPYAPGLSEDVYGDLFRDVGRNEDGRQKYFANRASVLSANPSIAFDSTTISTYSSNQTEARQGNLAIFRTSFRSKTRSSRSSAFL